MPALGQKRTYAPQQIASLFDYLIGAHHDCFGYVDPSVASGFPGSWKSLLFTPSLGVV